jgi:hypothetical protein
VFVIVAEPPFIPKVMFALFAPILVVTVAEFAAKVPVFILPKDPLLVTEIALLKIPLFALNCPTLQRFELVTVITEFKLVTSRLATPLMFEFDKLIESLIELTKSLPVDKELVEIFENV